MSDSIEIKYKIDNLRYGNNNIDFPKEWLKNVWQKFDFEEAENKVLFWQKLLSKAAFKRDLENIKKMQNKIVSSLEARMLAVKKVSDSNYSVGTDGVRWRKDEEKMDAAIFLNSANYKSKPLRRIIIKDKRGTKERRIGIPSLNDRAMQMLQCFALEPVMEAWGDRKSFAFRKKRSALDAHACLLDNLCDENGPEWILVADVKNYYESISHDWLLRNIPMDKRVLREFLKSGVCFNNELFPTEQGISLGCSISPMLGNMILDGLQYKLYDLQGETIKDYKNGYMVRFADDIVITARTKEDAKQFKAVVEEFIEERGLTLSERKTQIINVNEGFDFLSRHYVKVHNQIRVIPSSKAITNIEKELEDLILNPEKHWTQRSLIQAINSKLHGWAAYHRVEESKEIFLHIDVLVNALLLNLMKKTYPNKTIENLKNKYWYRRYDGKLVFSLPNNRNFAVINLSDIILIKHRRMDLKKNVFLDADYFEERDEKLEIDKISGKYKGIWERQEGKCYFCGKNINKDQDKTIIHKTFSKINKIADMVYVHEFCKNDDLLYIDTDILHLDNHSLNNILKDITKMKPKRIVNKWKYKQLEEYFNKETRTPLTLKFSDIENILGFKLCHSAYKYLSYWYQKEKGNMSNAWLNQEYEILKLNMEKQKVVFRKTKKKSSKLNIPQIFLTNKIPDSAKYELEEFFKYITKKYGLSNKK